MENNTTIAIQDYLPHREPMLLVDVITSLNDEEVQTLFYIDENSLFVENNVFLEVGLIENAAQTCASIVAKSYFFDDNNEEKINIEVIGFISGIKKISVYHLPKVADTIKTKAKLLSRFETDDYRICTMSCKTYLEEILLFEAEINLFIQEKK